MNLSCKFRASSSPRPLISSVDDQEAAIPSLEDPPLVLEQDESTEEHDRSTGIPSVEFSFLSHRPQRSAGQWPPRRWRSLHYARTGFTLIELLVVIAIIAILAAILFPVFAQAKVSAKVAATVTQAKQIGLAHIMYAGDYDDMCMMGGVWGSMDPDALKTGVQSGYLPWPALAEPYVKSISIYNTPLATGTQPFYYSALNQCDTARSCAIRYPHYGYNMTYLAPWIRSGSAFTAEPARFTDINRPAQQVMLTELWTRATCPSTTAWGSGMRAYATFAEAPPPDKKNAIENGTPTYTWGHFWGNDGANLAYGTIPTFEEGKYTGGISFRGQQKTSVVFADSHVKRLSPNQLADGTTWSLATKDMTSTDIHNLKNERYLWHPKGE